MRKKILVVLVVVALVLSVLSQVGRQAKAITLDNPVTIGVARNQPLGAQVYIQGNVTVVPGTFDKGFAIQDSTGGIYVFPTNQPTGIALGDVVQVKGTLKDYSGLLELSPVDSVTRASSGICPDPKVFKTGEIGESTEGLLVNVTGTVQSVTSSQFIVDDGSGPITIYIKSATRIDLSKLSQGNKVSVVGFSSQYNSTYEITPRSQGDIVVNKPNVVSVNPADGATGVNTNTTISATFNIALDISTVNKEAFTIKDSKNNPVEGTVSYDAGTKTITFTPTSLLANDFFTATLSGSIKDTSGQTMGTNYTWQFSTIISQGQAPTTTLTQSSDTSLKIFAVLYDTLENSLNEKGQAVCLINTGSNTEDISSYKITNFVASVQFPTGTTLAPNQKIWITREATEFKTEFNKEPNFEYGADTDTAIPNLIQVDGKYPIFNNAGGECAIFDTSNSIVDVVAWGTSKYSNTGWSGAPINPYIFANYISPKGDIAVRKLDETTGQPVPDTNTLHDWNWDPTDPIDGCKITYPGWDSYDTFFFPPKDTATVHTTFFASPDNSFAATKNFIDSAQKSIKIELYEITEIELMNEVLSRMDAGVKVTVLMDGDLVESNGSLYSQVSWFAQQVYNKHGIVYFLRSASPHDRYNWIHIKTIIVDDSKVLITSDNLTRSSMPCDNLSNGTSGERGTGVITDDPVIVKGVLNIFDHDFQPGYYDVSPYDPVKDAPPTGYVPPAMTTDYSGYFPVQPNPLTVNESESLELVDSPDTSMRNVDSIIGLLNKAGPGDLIIDETQYEYQYWGPSESQYINPRLQAMIAAAQRGAQVYLLLDSYNSSSTNTPTKNYLDSLGIATLHCLLGAPTGLGIHNKLFIERIGGLGYVNISSINGSENASRANRELGLIVQSNAGFEYFYKMFAFDWYITSGAVCNIKANALGKGNVKILPDSDMYLIGDKIYLTATPSEGYTFSSWSGDVPQGHEKDNPLVVTMDKNKAVTANFVAVGVSDTTPPVVELPSNLIAGLVTNTPTLNFSFSASDDSGKIARMVVKVNGNVQIDKNAIDTNPSVQLSEGTNNIEVTVYDPSGNYASKSFTAILDTKAPNISVTLPEKANSKELLVKGTVTDSGVGVQSVAVNGTQVTLDSAGGFETKITLSQGANTVTIEAIDKAGNKASQKYQVTYAGYTIVLTIGSPYININGVSSKIDDQGSTPVIKNSRTILPIRALVEALGGTISWDANERKVTITLGSTSIELWIGKSTASVNGSDTPIDSSNSKVVPEIINGRTYLPLRFVSENLGATVGWDQGTQTITVVYMP